MSKGIEMLMKSFGFDPNEIKKQVQKAGDDFKQVVNHFNTRMDTIEHKLDYLISLQKQPAMLAHFNGATPPSPLINDSKFAPETPAT